MKTPRTLPFTLIVLLLAGLFGQSSFAQNHQAMSLSNLNKFTKDQPTSLLPIFSLLLQNGSWVKTFGGEEADSARSLVKTSDGGFAFCGETSSLGAGGADVYFVKTDAQGNTQWTKTFGVTTSEYCRGVQQTSDGGYILTGYIVNNSTDNDYFALKTDSEGNEEWLKVIGGTGIDKLNDVQETSEGGYILIGNTESFALSSSDMYLVKMDANGNEIWTKVFSELGIELGKCVRQTSDGGFLLVGSTASSGALTDIFMVKTDGSGNEQWRKTFGGTGAEIAHSLQLTSDNNYIFTGFTTSFGSTSADILVIKTDGNGNPIWQRTYGGVQADIGYAIQQLPNGDFIIAGDSESYGATSFDIFLLQIDANGNELWSKTIGGNDLDFSNSVVHNGDDRFIIAGETHSLGAGNGDALLLETTGNPTSNQEDKVLTKTLGGAASDTGYSITQSGDDGYVFCGATQSFGSGDTDVYLVKSDQQGNEIWSQTFGAAGTQEYCRSVTSTSDGGYILAGYTIRSGTDHDYFAIKTDADGNDVWIKIIGGDNIDQVYDVQQTSDGGYILIGGTESFAQTLSDMYLVKMDADGNETWFKAYNDQGHEMGRSVKQTADGGFILVGSTEFAINQSNILVIKTDSAGTEEWKENIGGAARSYGNAVQLASNGDYIIGGFTTSLGSSSSDMYLVKMRNRTILWGKTFGGPSFDIAADLQESSDGGIIAVGSTGSLGLGQRDVFLVKTDGNGIQEWNQTFGGSRNDDGNSLFQADDGGFVIVGNTEPATPGNHDIFLIRTEEFRPLQSQL